MLKLLISYVPLLYCDLILSNPESQLLYQKDLKVLFLPNVEGVISLANKL